MAKVRDILPVGPTRTTGLGRRAALAVFGLSAVLLVGLATVVKRPSGLKVADETNAPREETVAQAAPRFQVVRLAALPRGGEVREQLALLNPVPLFMSVSRSEFEAGPSVAAERPTGQVEAEFPPRLSFPERAPTAGIFPVETPDTPQRAMEEALRPHWFDGLAHTESLKTSGPPVERAARVEVYRVGQARVLRAYALAAGALGGDADDTWRPMQLTILVDKAGLVGLPSVSVSSGAEERDEQVRRLIGRELLPILPLRPGIYRVEVGP